jgi:hypothetical protein
MEELLKAFNKERKANKGKWVFFHGTLDGLPVAIKSYNTWIQILDYNGKRDGGPMDCLVGKMNCWLQESLRAMAPSKEVTDGSLDYLIYDERSPRP